MRIASLLLWFGLLSARAIASSLSFLSVGDWGFKGTDQLAVAYQMQSYGQEYNISFVLALGDNFYEDGVVSDTDPQWQTSFRDIYIREDNSSLNVPWYSILGNHDYHTNPEAQIDYTRNKRDNNWQMPAHFYKEKFAGDGFTVDMFFLDTIWFAPKLYPKLVVEDVERKAAEQRKWLEQELANSRATYAFVVGHYPVFSVGENGDGDEMMKAIKDLLEKYQVDLYLCGHDHTLQHLKNNKVNFYVNGNGAKKGTIENKEKSKADKVEFAVVEPGFMVHEIDQTQMITRFIDSSGRQIYKDKITAKRSVTL